jgi:hypothetical protein
MEFASARRGVFAAAWLYLLALLFSVFVNLPSSLLARLGMDAGVVAEVRAADVWVGVGLVVALVFGLIFASEFSNYLPVAIVAVLALAILTIVVIMQPDLIADPHLITAVARIVAAAFLAPVLLSFVRSQGRRRSLAGRM